MCNARAFAGSATDAEDGDLTASLAWSSNRDGAIGTGGAFSATLSVGTHTVTATATDALGAPGSGSLSVTINALPTVSITVPADGTVEDTGVAVTFTGTASDPEDGDRLFAVGSDV